MIATAARKADDLSRVAAAPTPGALSAEQTATIARLAQALSPDQLHWVSGYFAGLAAAHSAVGAENTAVAPVAGAQAASTLTILYGSQTGNGRAIAERVHADAEQRGIAATLADMADYRPAMLKNETQVLFIVSTHGEGDPPDDAEALHELLHGRRAPQLDGLHYSVLALGDSSYAHFCQTGRDFDERLSALGAKRLHPRIDCDVDYEDAARAWADAVIAEIATRAADSGELRAAPVLRALPKVASHDRNRPFQAELLVSQPITGQGSSWPVHHIELALDGAGIDYEPGDSLGVLATNPPALVEEICATLDLDPAVTVSTPSGEHSLGAALAEIYDITALHRGFLNEYAAQTNAPALAALLAAGEGAELAAFLASRQIIDVLREFPARPDAQQFTGMLRRRTPRLYSIASSPLASPDEVHLTVAVVRYDMFGHAHEGAASTYLAERRAEGERVPVYLQRNERFRLPENGDAPVIMIGPGTGVAPFRAFVEQREALGARGRNWLFYGARRFESDFLYHLEWLRHRKRGLLNELDVAFSRDQDHKIYVQHRMRERAGELYAWLEQGAHLYVCGASAMAADVHAALLEIVQAESRGTPERATEYLKALKREGRYQRDVY